MEKRSPYLLSVSLAAILAWLSYWLITTRYALLDDALIHLHYADLLHRYHFITFDGIRHGFGTSSLLYVSLLAVLRGFSTSPLLGKLVSDLSYLFLVGIVFGLVVKLRQHTSSQLLLAGLLFCLLSPMGIRWLTDGMETSLTNLLIVILAVITKTEQASYTQSKLRYLLLVVFGAILVYQRIELALIVALCCLSILLIKLSNKKSPVAAVIEASPLSVGAVLAMISIRLALGNFLPDTALAKSSHLSLSPIFTTVQVLTSSLLLGAGCALCWIFSVLLAFRRIGKYESPDTARIVAFVLENIAIFLVVALSCMRGQAIQAARYVVWPLIFGIVANALQLAHNGFDQTGKRPLDGLEKGLAVAFVIFFLCALPLDWRWASIAMRGRSQTLTEMRAAHLDQLFRDKTIIASDVGFITYFTNARTCDLAGLVDGRAIAAMTPEQRLTYCAQQSPAMLFLTSSQTHRVEQAMNLNDWSVCGIYDFPNVRSNDRHYLIVPSADADAVCRQLDFSPKPVPAVVPKTS